MSHNLKKFASLMLAFFVAFGMMAAGTGEASAASGKVVVYVSGHVIEDGMDLDNHIYVGEKGYAGAYHTTNYDKVVVVKNVTVSNKAVAKVVKSTYKMDGKTYKDFFVLGKKPGKTKVSIKYKYNGNVKTKKVTVTVVEYPKPIKSLTVNGIKKKITKDRYLWYDQKYKKSKTTAKIKLVPADGWKIKRVNGDITYIKDNDYKTKRIKSPKSKITKGTTISFPKKYRDLHIHVEMVRQDGKEFHYEISLYRP